VAPPSRKAQQARVCRQWGAAARDTPNSTSDLKQVDLILATGGGPMVKAAYSSGKPAHGVGAGNALIIVDETADLKDAADKIMRSKTFDHAKWGLWFLFVLIGTQMVPPLVDLIPLYIIFSRILKLVDTKLALIIGYTGWLLPISVWILYGYFQTIPRDLESAARIDGCTRLQALFRVVMPLSAPGIAASTW